MATRLVVRADADAATGTGHVMRCLALAQHWKDRGLGEVTFLTRCDSPRLLQRLEAEGFHPVQLPASHPDASDLRTALSVLEREGPGAWLALDGYHFDPGYQQAVRQAGHRLLVVDDNAHLPRYHADVLLNQNLHAEGLDYRCDPETVLLLGTRYALLRREFQAWRGWRREIPATARRVLVTLGGADPSNATLKVVRALKTAPLTGLHARVVVGPANPNVESLRREASSAAGRVEVLPGADDMARLMAWADVAVSGAGTTCWELAFMGLPSVLVAMAENQRPLAAGMQQAGAAVSLGQREHLEKQALSEALASLTQDRARREAMSQAGRALVDGLGAQRAGGVMTALASRRFPCEPALRPATTADALPLWRLANDPSVRANSFNPDPIPWESHVTWLNNKLSSPDCRMWVADFEGVVAGQVRYDRAGPDCAEIGYAVHPAFRGCGLGTLLLAGTSRDALDQLAISRVRGIVKVANGASARSFEKSGFKQIGPSKVSGFECLLFEMRR